MTQTAIRPNPKSTRERPQASDPSSNRFDAQLVEDTRQEIRSLVSEIESLAAADISQAEFYAGFLSRIVSALAGVGGAIWIRSAEGPLTLAYQANLPEIELPDPSAAEQHALLLEKLWEASQPQLVPPHAGAAAPASPGNPTERLLVIAPIVLEGETQALVEIFQRSGGGPTAQRGYLRFVTQMCSLAAEYLKNRQLRQYHDRQALWRQFETFLRGLHGRLDVRHATFTLANEGRRLVECDRLSVLLTRGRQAQLTAVSGVDTIDRRAAEARALESLARIVLATGQPVWFAGETSGLAPQIDDALHGFVDVSQARAVGVVPLFPREHAEQTNRKRRPIGALIAERWQQSGWSEATKERVLTVAEHGGLALANAQEHQGLFLLPLWKAIGKVAWTQTIPKTLLVLLLASGLIAALCLVPRELHLAARGKLQPVERRDIFARTDGVVVDVPVQHAQIVDAGHVLAQLRNTDLDVEIATLLGRRTTLQQQLATAQRALLHQSQLGVEEQNRIAGEVLELKQALDSLEQQLDLYQHKQEQLIVRSEGYGQVVTWQVRELLLSRPVQRGQVLMTLVDPRGAWELELLLPEKRLGHALAAAEAAGRQQRPLPVSFQLSTHPGREFHGEVVEIYRRAEVHGEDGNMVLIKVAIEKTELPELHSETTVTARLHCGLRPLGYVLFQDVIETVQGKLMFWF